MGYILLNDKYSWESVIQDALKSKAEYNFLDFKLMLTDDNNRLKEHINAFGNLERGGCFVFGVDTSLVTEEPMPDSNRLKRRASIG